MKEILIVLVCVSLLCVPASSSPGIVLRPVYSGIGVVQIVSVCPGIRDLVPLVLRFLPFWEFPQNLIGSTFFAAMFFSGRICRIMLEDGCFFAETDIDLSLGCFIFFEDDFLKLNKRHEFGHAIQSCILGPLYLLVVGVPSFCRKQYEEWHLHKTGKDWQDYYSGFPEDWADRLGGVDPRCRP